MLVTFLLLFFLYVFKILTKKTLILSSHDRQKTDYKLSLILNESFRNIKLIKLNNNVEYFSNLFKVDNSVWSKSFLVHNFLNFIPKFLLEIYILLILLFAFFFISFFDFKKDDLVVTGIFFLIAAYRMLPSFNRITSCIQGIIYSTPVVDRIFNQLIILKNIEKINFKNTKAINFLNQIEVKDVCFSYSEHKIILNQINFIIKKGTIFGIIGKSGIGKSTLIDVILGFLNPQHGEVLVDHVNIKKNLTSWQSKIGYVSQRIFLNDDSIENNIIFGHKSINRQSVLDEVIKQTQLNDLVKIKKISLEDKVGEQGIQLSGGQVQRVAIARALYRNPELLVLDEATSGLDIDSEAKILEFVKKIKNITVMVISHRDTIKYFCDDVLELN